MKKIFTIIFLVFSANAIAQNIKLEISDYYKTLDSTKFCTFQFASASGSYSRPTLVFFTDKKILQTISQNLAKIYKEKKQEFTDVWVLGFYNFNPESFSKTDDKIIQKFYEEILKYRRDNNLPFIRLEELRERKIVLKNIQDICKNFECPI